MVDRIIKTEKVAWMGLLELQPDNLKVNTDSSHVKESLKNNDFASAFNVWQDEDDKIYIVDGHFRKSLLVELESEGFEVPELLTANFLDLKDRKEAIKYLLEVFNTKQRKTDNTILAEWLEVESVDVEDIEVQGLNTDEDITTPQLQAEEDDYEQPDEVHTDIVKGDLFEFKKGELCHRLLCGDSTSKEDVERLMGGEKADMVFTDPPYGIGIVQGNKVGGGGELKFKDIVKGQVVRSSNYSEIKGDDTTNTARLFYELCIELGFVNYIIWGGNYFTDFLPPSMGWIVWHKKQSGNFADFEMAWTSYNKASRLYEYLWNGLAREGERRLELNNRVHPTQKPVGLSASILNNYSFTLCYDGFLGSHTTMVACHEIKKNCYGIEYEPHYCQIGIDRMLKLDDDIRLFKNGVDITEEARERIYIPV